LAENAVTLALVHLMPSFSHLLYGVGQGDPLTLVGVSGVLLFAAAVACYIPARRAIVAIPWIACELKEYDGAK
jgi:hypothetical protein